MVNGKGQDDSLLLQRFALTSRFSIYYSPFTIDRMRCYGGETKKEKRAEGKIRIQYYRSFIATPKTHKQMVRSLGLTKLNQIVERPDTDSMRGAVAKIPHLLRIVE